MANYSHALWQVGLPKQVCQCQDDQLQLHWLQLMDEGTHPKLSIYTACYQLAMTTAGPHLPTSGAGVVVNLAFILCAV